MVHERGLVRLHLKTAVRRQAHARLQKTESRSFRQPLGIRRIHMLDGIVDDLAFIRRALLFHQILEGRSVEHVHHGPVRLVPHGQ